MQMAEILSALRYRVPFHVMKDILTSKKQLTGNGWDATIDKLIKANKTEGNIENTCEFLFEFYMDHLLYGEKLVRFYTKERKIVNKFADVLKKIEPESSIYGAAYPLPLSDSELRGLDVDGNPYLVDVSEDTKPLTLVFCATKFYAEKVKLSVSDLSKKAQLEYDNYDEILAVKYNPRQVFDVVTVNPITSQINILIDYSYGFSEKTFQQRFKKIVTALNDLAAVNGINLNLKMSEAINLFSSIDNLYESSEGRICELAFTTNEGSIKHEKMRRNDLDLRGETYHKAGKEAVGEIVPYKLGLCWKVKFNAGLNSTPELFLPGNFRMLSSSKQSLKDAIITKNCGKKDYTFTIKKLLSNL